MKQKWNEELVTKTLFQNEVRRLENHLVSKELFQQEINRLDGKVDLLGDTLSKKIDSVDTRLDKKIDNLALSLMRTQEDVRSIKETTATKSDINTILERIDFFGKKLTIFDQEEGVQSLHLKEVRQQVGDHERRLTALEAQKS